ncbi:MAG: VOC family protein [Nitrospirota bacterium]|nr:VOC family protein [Nitrospirota bacterium]
MAIELNHTIVPARNKVASAKLFARILGLSFDEGAVGYFAPVRINKTLTLDFDEDADRFDIHHYAFKVSEAEFDAIFDRIQAEGIPYGAEPHSRDDMKINHRAGGRGVYFCDPNGHILELLTVE